MKLLQDLCLLTFLCYLIILFVTCDLTEKKRGLLYKIYFNLYNKRSNSVNAYHTLKTQYLVLFSKILLYKSRLYPTLLSLYWYDSSFDCG